MSDTAIKIEHLSKYYNLGVINNGSFYRDVQTWIALKRGKNDPHSELTAEQYASSADGFWALKDLNFEIKQGERLGIIGKNGAGKSTLLKVLSRITAPTEGRAKIKGRVASLLEVGTGFHGELTGRENIYLNGAILGMKKREIDKKLDEIIDFSEIEQHIDTPVKRYSSGMYVRLAFAVAAHLESEILIADEVLAVGDASFQKKAIGKMNALSTTEGRTILFVSHQTDAVSRLCTSGIILHKSRLEYHNDDIKDVISHYLRPDVHISRELMWQNNGDFTDKFFAPQKIYLMHNDEVTNEFMQFDDNVHCVIEADIKELHSALNIVFALYRKSDNVLIFVSALKDFDVSDGLHVGFNTLKVKLPTPNFLPRGEYYIDIFGGVDGVKTVITQQTILLPFSVLSDASRQGVILQNIPWNVNDSGVTGVEATANKVAPTTASVSGATPTANMTKARQKQSKRHTKSAKKR